MKKTIAGVGFMLTGTMLALGSTLAGGMMLESTTSWVTSLGRFGQTLIDNALMPLLVIGYLFLAFGTVITIWSIFSKRQKGDA